MPDKQDKQFDPTQKRLDKAREDGNVFRSQEVLSVGMLAASTVMLAYLIPTTFGQMQLLMGRFFRNSLAMDITPGAVQQLLADVMWHLALIMLPFFGVLLFLAIALNVMQSGLNLTVKPLQPKLESINPLKGFKRLFSSKGLFDTGKSILKIAVVGPIAFYVISGHLEEIMMLHTVPLISILDASTGWMMTLVAQVLIALLLIAAADFAYEKWKYNEDLKMSKQEVEDERKEQDGDPHMKGKQRELARKMRDRPRLDHAVMKADVVITNPTHYAIALRYDLDEAAAPKVMCKGLRRRALRIKELAHDQGIPTVEDRPLAHALYDNVEEEEQIPEDLYPAVAAILAEIYREQQGGYA